MFIQIKYPPESIYLYAWAGLKEEPYIHEEKPIRSIKFYHAGNQKCLTFRSPSEQKDDDNCITFETNQISFKEFCGKLFQHQEKLQGTWGPRNNCADATILALRTAHIPISEPSFGYTSPRNVFNEVKKIKLNQLETSGKIIEYKQTRRTLRTWLTHHNRPTNPAVETILNEIDQREKKRPENHEDYALVLFKTYQLVTLQLNPEEISAYNQLAKRFERRYFATKRFNPENLAWVYFILSATLIGVALWELPGTPLNQLLNQPQGLICLMGGIGMFHLFSKTHVEMNGRKHFVPTKLSTEMQELAQQFRPRN